MKPYSMDLRQRVIEAYEGGEGTQEELAATFGVSAAFIERLLSRWRKTRSIAPTRNTGGRRAKVADETLQRLREAVQESPDATLTELRDKCGVDGSIMCVFRALRRMGITLKKSRSHTQNNSMTRSKKNEGRGGVG